MLKVLSQARTPAYDATETREDQPWSEVPKTLTHWTGALGYEGVSTVADLTREQRLGIAQHTLLGDPGAESWRALLFFPVVNPETSDLNEGALLAVISGRGGQADIPQSALASARNVADELLQDEFTEQDATLPFDEMSMWGVADGAEKEADENESETQPPATQPTSQPMKSTTDPVELEGVEMLRTPEDFVDVKDVQLDPDSDRYAGTVRGYYASFGNADVDEDRFAPDAFNQSLERMGPDADRQRIKHLHMHRADQWLGEPHILKPDDHGLLFETRILDTDLGSDVMMGYKEDIFEHSVGFLRMGEEQLEDGTTLITKARLFEGSTVPWGANPLTPTVGVKSYGTVDAAIEDLQEKVDTIRRLLREGMSPATKHGLELTARQVEAALKQLSLREDEVVGGLHVKVYGESASVEEQETKAGTEFDEQEDEAEAVKLSSVNLFPSDDEPDDSSEPKFFPTDE